MRLNGLIGGIGVIILAMNASARAQGVFGGGSTAFDPQISVVNTGAVLDAKPVVSHDLKYVTITAQPSNSALLALRNFSFQQLPPNLGFVGSQAIQQVVAKEHGDRSGRAVLPTPSPMDHIGITKID